MEKITCVAIDDEQLALRVIEQYVSETPSLSLAAQFRNPLDATQWLKHNKCDILFLDIQMPQQNGMDFLRSMETSPVIIFTTAYSEFAADAFDLDAVDYLRKPFSYDRFLKSIEKATDYLRVSKDSIGEVLHSGAENFISVRVNGKLEKILFSEIIYVEAFQEYIKIFTERGRYITYERMKNMEALLPSDKFMRVHRSFIVALQKVTAMSGNLIEIDTHQIPLSRDLKEELIRRVFLA